MNYTIFLFISFVSIHASAQGYEFKENIDKYKVFEKVKFINGDYIKYDAIGGDPNFYKQISYFNKNKKENLLTIQDDVVRIRAAYPNEKNASVAIITSTCNGSSCESTKYYVAYLYGNKLYVNELNENNSGDIKIKIDISKKSMPAISASNNTDMDTNKYGDLVKDDRQLINGKGFVRSTFKRKYLKLVNVHPDDYFSNSAFREALAEKIGYNHFKTLRSYMDVASESVLIEGQYIVMSGMLPHSGAAQTGVLVIDAVNEKYFAVWADVDERIIFKGTTGEWNSRVGRIVVDRFMNSNYFLEYKNNAIFMRKKEK